MEFSTLVVTVIVVVHLIFWHIRTNMAARDRGFIDVIRVDKGGNDVA